MSFAQNLLQQLLNLNDWLSALRAGKLQRGKRQQPAALQPEYGFLLSSQLWRSIPRAGGR